MKKYTFISFLLLTLSQNTFSKELNSVEGVYTLGKDTYIFSVGGEPYLPIVKNGVVKGKMRNGYTRIFKLSNEYVAFVIENQWIPLPTIFRISNDYKVKEINFNYSDIPTTLKNDFLDCNPVQVDDFINLTCYAGDKKKYTFKYKYSAGNITKVSEPNTQNVNEENCKKEYSIYKELRAKNRSEVYTDLPLSITRNLNTRLKNVNEFKYMGLLNNMQLIPYDTFRYKLCRI